MRFLKPLRIICPVVVELDRNACGKVVIGRNTRMACDLAISIAEEDPANSMIITAAGCAGKEWDNAWAGGLMANYVKSRTKARVLRQMADHFDDRGEMSLVAYTAHHMMRGARRSMEIVLVEQSGHARQTASICRQLLDQLNLMHVTVSPQTYEPLIGWRAVARKYFGVWPRNLFASFKGQ